MRFEPTAVEYRYEYLVIFLCECQSTCSEIREPDHLSAPLKTMGKYSAAVGASSSGRCSDCLGVDGALATCTCNAGYPF
jgi:hypothetical protein